MSFQNAASSEMTTNTQNTTEQPTAGNNKWIRIILRLVIFLCWRQFYKFGNAIYFIIQNAAEHWRWPLLVWQRNPFRKHWASTNMVVTQIPKCITKTKTKTRFFILTRTMTGRWVKRPPWANLLHTYTARATPRAHRVAKRAGQHSTVPTLTKIGKMTILLRSNVQVIKGFLANVFKRFGM